MIADRARIHRRGDMAALALFGVDTTEAPTNTGTVYMSAALADRLADELRRYAADVRAVEFTASQLGTANVTETSE